MTVKRKNTDTAALDLLNADTNLYSANALNQYTGVTGEAAVPSAYDKDGNLTACALPGGNWLFSWDAENRLAAAERLTFDASGYRVRVRNVYDPQSRRAVRQVQRRYYIEDAGMVPEEIRWGAPVASSAFAWDGWHPVREHVSTNTLTGTPPDLRYRLWGLDLSGAPGGGGGGGGLLAEYRGIAPRPAAVPTGGAGARAVIPPADPGPETPSASVWFPCYDANGNVTEYVDTDGAVAAHYEYDPFGNTTAMSGPAADQFPFRFSTKCFDAETGLYYYGYRFYSPELGRWLSRDPIGEIDAAGLYLFCANNSIDDIDSYGLWKLKLAVDRIFKVASRGYVSFSGRADLGNGNGILELSAMGGIRFYFTEVITPGPIMGTVFGVFLEKQHIAQEVRIGAGGGGALECKCPDDSKAITCTLTKLFVSLSVQGLLGYQGNNARILGQASGGGQWDVLSGKVSLTGNIGVRAQWRKNQTWSGWEASKSGNIPLPFTLGSIGHKHFNIPLSKTCKCMSEDMDGSRLLEGLFHGLGN